MKQLNANKNREITKKTDRLLEKLRYWLNSIDVSNPKVAHLLCQLIPASCPFARDVKVFSHRLYIPPLCKLNPLYNELMGLRFRALTFLTEKAGENSNF